jgi:TRAP-type C4-dicarboxylate transport system permease small subunit
MLSFRDLAPVIVVTIVIGFLLLLTWHAWHQAHSQPKKGRKGAPEAGE